MQESGVHGTVNSIIIICDLLFTINRSLEHDITSGMLCEYIPRLKAENTLCN